MRTTERWSVGLPSNREVTVTRRFDAPRRLVFEAFTRPELVMLWLWGPDDWPLVHCEINLKVGGALRYVWRHHEKGEMGLSGVFREIVLPERIVHTELFDQDWTGGETLVTTVFEEQDGRTTVTGTVRYVSQEVRDAVLKTGMVEGWDQCHNRLAALLPTLPALQDSSAAARI